MTGLALWNDWLYEAFAEASDRDIMVLNLDAFEDYESSLAGWERQHLVYNPGPNERTFRVIFKHLPDADYSVTIGSREAKHAATELKQGLSLTLKPGEHQRITVHRTDYREHHVAMQQQLAAQNAMAHAYALMQQAAVIHGRTIISDVDIEGFTEAVRLHREGRLTAAKTAAAQIVHKFKDLPPTPKK